MAAILKKWPPYLLCSLLQELSTQKLFRMVPQTRWYPTTFYSIPCQVDPKNVVLAPWVTAKLARYKLNSGAARLKWKVEISLLMWCMYHQHNLTFSDGLIKQFGRKDSKWVLTRRFCGRTFAVSSWNLSLRLTPPDAPTNHYAVGLAAVTLRHAIGIGVLDFHQLRGQNFPNLRHHCRCLMNNSCPLLHLLRIHPLQNSVRGYFPPFFSKWKFSARSIVSENNTLQYNTPGTGRAVHNRWRHWKSGRSSSEFRSLRRATFTPFSLTFFVKFLPLYRDFEQTKFISKKK